MAAQPNYTDEMVTKMVADYQDGVSVDAIAEAIGKSVRSVRSKLVREGVYVAQPKVAKTPKAEGPTKKEMLNELEALAPFKVDGLMGATKEVIGALIAHFKADAETEAEAEVEVEVAEEAETL